MLDFCPYRNWKDVTEQPYEKTARIPLHKAEPIIQAEPKTPHKARQTRKRQTKRKRKVTPRDPLARYYRGHKLREPELRETRL